MPCSQCAGIKAQFNDKVAQRELKRFKRKGAKSQTGMLLDELRRLGIAGRTLLDIGGGVGAIQHVCANEGAAAITNIDASPAYLRVCRTEGAARGYEDIAEYVLGDFAELAAEVDPADLVTMDRVVCCYHDLPGLLRPAAEHTRIGLGLVFPRDNVWMRAGARVANFILRLGRSEFQAFVHPHDEIMRITHEAGLRLGFSAFKGIWRVAVFVRT